MEAARSQPGPWCPGWDHGVGVGVGSDLGGIIFGPEGLSVPCGLLGSIPASLHWVPITAPSPQL